MGTKKIYPGPASRSTTRSTDWPISLKELSYTKAVELFRDHMTFIPPQDHAQILSGTVQQVWPFH